jgi:transferrin binding protein
MKTNALAFSLALLASCGGGGGGGGVAPGPGPSPTVAPAAGGGGGETGGGSTQPASAPYPTLSTANGGDLRVFTAIMSQQAGDGPSRGQVTANADGAGNYTFTVNALQDAPAYTFTVGLKSGPLMAVAGTSCGNCFRSNPIDLGSGFGQITFLDADTAGLGYLSIGNWAVFQPNGSASGGSAVVGVPTRSADLPKTGTATYAGQFIGTYRIGHIFDTIGATASSIANFGTGVVTLQTTNSQRQYTPEQAMPQLDFSGSMNFLSSGGTRTNQLQGTVVTRGGLAGDAHGSFYGPGAQELGGAVVFRSPGLGNESFMGAFGMKKQ